MEQEKRSAKQIIISPFLNPNNAPASNEYTVLGNAGITILVDLRRKIPKGARGPSALNCSFKSVAATKYTK